jgi:hypothetical protein
MNFRCVLLHLYGLLVLYNLCDDVCVPHLLVDIVVAVVVGVVVDIVAAVDIVVVGVEVGVGVVVLVQTQSPVVLQQAHLK